MQLLNWAVLQNRLKGVVVDHPKLGCQSITTSTIEDITEHEDKLVIQTHSGSIYELDLSRTDKKKLDSTLKALQELGVTEKTLQSIKEAKPYVLPIDLNDGSLYIEIAGNTAICAYCKRDDKTVELNVSIHIGTFQDSILIIDYEGNIDFRYFPHALSAIDIYRWEGFTNLIINNVSEQAAYVQRDLMDPDISIPTGVTCFSKEFCTRQ